MKNNFCVRVKYNETIISMFMNFYYMFYSYDVLLFSKKKNKNSKNNNSFLKSSSLTLLKSPPPLESFLYHSLSVVVL